MTEDDVGEDGVAPVDTGCGGNVLLSHEFLGALLALVSMVAANRLAAVDALVSTTERLIENGEGKAR